MLPNARHDNVRLTKLEHAIHSVSMRQGTRAPEDCVISSIPAYLHIENSTRAMATSLFIRFFTSFCRVLL
jgi:hypothetical protein